MSDDRYDRRRYYNEDTFGIQSTAGAVPVRNKKGEVSMQKVKVQRYISGKRPTYAKNDRGDSSDEDESDEDDFTVRQRQRQREEWAEERREVEDDEHQQPPQGEEEIEDPRLRRLAASRSARPDDSPDSDSDDGEKRIRRRRVVHQPEILSDGDEEEDEKSDDSYGQGRSDGIRGGTERMELESDDSSSGEDDLDEAGLQRRRELMRQRATARAQIGVGQEETMAREEEKSASEEEEESSSEEETSGSDEEEGARLKPVFVRKKDRLTVHEREQEEARQRQLEIEAQKVAEVRRKETLRMVEATVKREVVERKMKDNDPQGLHEVNTDDENEEAEYESWKLRELKRMKRDRERREAREKELNEIERVRNMTEEERRQEFKANPKQITNKAVKGKYKFMQKYYHRGAFFMEKEENVYKRDYSDATLEDKFDKTVLPKVMQVKNFGRSGRTKYTHLVDQDTTQFDSAWSKETVQNLQFQLNHAGGMKGSFERPSAKKKK